MEITFLGQAGLYIETRHGSVLCDPWFNSAYFGSWFPFPANDGLDPEAIDSPDYLYVSHLPHDHFDLETLQALGPHDAHFLQFSGAIWFPMVYRFRPDVKEAWARKKIRNQNERAFRYAEQVGATHVFPCAGPPSFLDDDLFHLNDMEGGDPSSIFPDQTVFLEY